MPFLVVFIAVLLIVLFYFLSKRQSRQADSPEDPDTFDFEPDTQSVTPTVLRKVRVVAPVQTFGDTKQRVYVQANPFPPGVDQVNIPSGKGIDALLTLVIEPVVRRLDNDAEVNDFSDELSLTIYYTAKEVAATELDSFGRPMLSIVSGYRDESEVWRLERLDTRVTPDPNTGGGTLTAKLKTLHPKDPQWIGRP
jgi:hypothetical protein